MSPRHIVHRVLVYGVAGLVTTVAVAWALAAWAPQRATQVVWYGFDAPEASGADRYVFTEFHGLGCVRIQTQLDVRGPLSELGEMKAWSPQHASDCRYERRERLARWSWPSTVVRLGLGWPEAVVVTDDARGWPALAMRCRQRLLPDLEAQGGGAPIGESIIEGGVRLGPVPTRGANVLWLDGARFRALPLIPLWGGLWANTAFYAACWAGLMQAFLWVRGNVRRARGLCPRCAYELGAAWEAGCPECGWRKPAAAASSNEAR